MSIKKKSKENFLPDREFNNELAVKIGLNEAILLQQIRYWIEIHTAARESEVRLPEGKYWVYYPCTKQKEEFRYWSATTTQVVIKSLMEKGLLISTMVPC